MPKEPNPIIEHTPEKGDCRGIFKITPNAGVPYYVVGRLEVGWFRNTWWYLCSGDIVESTSISSKFIVKFNNFGAAADYIGLFKKVERVYG